MMHVLHPNVRGPSFGLVSKFEWKTDHSSYLGEALKTRGRGLLSISLPASIKPFARLQTAAPSGPSTLVADTASHCLAIPPNRPILIVS